MAPSQELRRKVVDLADGFGRFGASLLLHNRTARLVVVAYLFTLHLLVWFAIHRLQSCIVARSDLVRLTFNVHASYCFRSQIAHRSASTWTPQLLVTRGTCLRLLAFACVCSRWSYLRTTKQAWAVPRWLEMWEPQYRQGMTQMRGLVGRIRYKQGLT